MLCSSSYAGLTAFTPEEVRSTISKGQDERIFYIKIQDVALIVIDGADSVFNKKHKLGHIVQQIYRKTSHGGVINVGYKHYFA